MHRSLTLGRFSVAALFAVAALIIGISTAFAAAPNWNTTGNYEVAFTCAVGCSGTYNHDLSLVQTSGSLTGSGGNPVGAHVYNWALTSGTVDADTINFTADYSSTADAVTPQTTMNVVGTIVGGSMSGTWTDNYQGTARSGTWTTVSGTAAPIAPPSNTTVVVSGNTAAGENQDGWMFNRDASTQTPYSFQPGNASIGSGSLFVPPITNTGNGNNDKFIGELFLLDPLSGFNSISYDFKIASTGVVANKDHFYMNVYITFGESPTNKFYDCRYDVIPTTGVVDGYTTVTFDPTLTYPVTTRGGATPSPYPCPASPSGMDALDVGSPSIRAIAISVGDTSGSDTGVSGYYDKVVVNTDSGITTYDFDPAPAPTPVNVTIVKYVNEVHATAGNANNAVFPMQATYDFTNDQFPNGIAGSDPYDIGPTGNNTPDAYEAKTLQFNQGADYSTYERTNTSVVGASCADGKPFALNGYSYGDSLAAAQSAATSSVAPAFVDMTSNKYVIVHNKTCAAPPAPMVKVTIDKFINGQMATSGSANSASFPMQSSWNAANLGGAGSGNYALSMAGFNSPNAYEAVTSDMTSGSSYSTNEVTGGSVVGATCADGKPFALNGYSVGDSFAAAQSAATSSMAPALTNITTNKYIIVWNKTCAAPPAPQPVNACATPTVAPAGHMIVNGSNKSDNVTLSPNTMFVGKGGNDRVQGGNGNFIVCTGAGNDYITLGNGNSVVDTDGGNDLVELGNGTMNVKTGAGNDQITTGSGNDTIDAGGGNNSISSGGGNDSITAGAGNDSANAGPGTDTCALGGGTNSPSGCEL